MTDINQNKDYKKEFASRLIKFSLDSISLCSSVQKHPGLRFLSDQLSRSATSIGANVIEARGSGSKRDFVRFFQIALKSANETKYWLVLIDKSCPEYSKRAERLLDECSQIAKIIASSILTMKGKKTYV